MEGESAGKNPQFLSHQEMAVVESPQGQVTQLLQSASEGDAQAADDLAPLVYEELRQLAHRQMAAERPGQTLQPTALVHEAYVRLVGADVEWQSRGHFFAAAARSMRQILVNRAHRRQAVKRGGGRLRIDLADIELVAEEPRPEILLSLDGALEKLERIDERKARIVMLRYFAGLTIEETAQALDISSTTVKDDWQFARTWLYREMMRDG